MPKAQWILYDQCHLDSLDSEVSHVFFILFTGKIISSPVGNLSFNIRSRVAEYAIAKSFLGDCLNRGYTVDWIEADSYSRGIEIFVEKTGITNIVSMRSSEEYLARKIELYRSPNYSLSIFPNRQFLIDEQEFSSQFTKPPVMETFYRYMRKSRHILIDNDGKPTGGSWNYDHENRGYDSGHVPSWNWRPRDTAYIQEAKNYFGVPSLDFLLPSTRSDALDLMNYFFEHHFHDFGKLEDAMYREDAMVHHSLLSTSLNFGLLSPREVIDKASTAQVGIASMEGFIRQILGWREYMRQFYLYYYDSLYRENTLDHQGNLPKKWWNYDANSHAHDTHITGMNCVDRVIERVQETNYSHHIERLMVIGNYTLLMGYHPHQVNKWFWEMYSDAFEWVVSPNVLGMSQYSDGGKLATKPYISGGNYIGKMSNYCSSCTYSVAKKTCPMTHLYWDFIDRNQEIFKKGRTPYVLSTLAKLDIENIRKAKEIFIRHQL